MPYILITPSDLKPKPDDYEQRTAAIVANHFKTDIRFVKRGAYPSPDLYLMRQRQYWEIKHIRKNGKRTIANALRASDSQSENVVISLLRAENMTAAQASGRINAFLQSGPTRIKRIVLATKSHKALDIKQ